MYQIRFTAPILMSPFLIRRAAGNGQYYLIHRPGQGLRQAPLRGMALNSPRKHTEKHGIFINNVDIFRVIPWLFIWISA
jgi:hypothetical protein